MDKKLLIEKIETKIEEYKENLASYEPSEDDDEGDPDFADGVITGLMMALQLINE